MQSTSLYLLMKNGTSLVSSNHAPTFGKAGLMIVDEVHLLGADRRPIIEGMVSLACDT